MEVIEGFDLGTWNFFQTHRLPLVDTIMLGFSLLGNPALLLLVFLSATLVALHYRRVAVAVFLIGSFAGSYGLLLVTVQLVERERPQPVNPLVFPHPFLWILAVEPITSWSFPSDRALLATATYLSLGLVLRDLGRKRLFWLLAALAFLVGVSRMYIGSCFPTDVFGGWLGGTAWVLLCRWAQEKWTPVGAVAGPVPEANLAASEVS